MTEERAMKTDQGEKHVERAAMFVAPPPSTLFYAEESIQKFSGNEKTYSSSQWATVIEENAEIFGWTPLQKLIVARRSLISTAALWLKSEKPFTTYESLRDALIKEFPDKLSSKEIHEIMSKRKKHRNETCYEYYLSMKELARRGKLADYVAIQYIVEGIPDNPSNKIMLYGVSTYTDLLKKDVNFTLNDECKLAFNLLKEKLISNPVLKIYNPKLYTELHTDASSIAISAILMQKCSEDGELHPVHYMSRKTNIAESRYTSYELEALAIVEGVRKFRHYLFGINFRIVTDCKAFEMTLNKKDLAMSTKVARWILFLEDFTFTIEHREGSKMKHTDALSRNPYIAVTTMQESIREAQQTDKKLKVIKDILKDHTYEDYYLDNGILYKSLDRKLVIPSKMENEIISKAHNVGHFAKKKTMELISKDYYIEGLEKKVEDFISVCIPCLLASRKSGKQEGFLNPIQKESTPLHTLHLDHIGPMTDTKKQYNHILTFIDAFTKFVWLFPTKSTTTKETIDKLRIHQQTFGNPVRIITDRGTAFTSTEFSSYCEEENIQHIKITTGVPRGNGQVERVHRTIISVLTKLCIETPALWYRHVSRLQRALNNTLQRSITMTPYELMIGVKMRTKEDCEIYRLLQEEERDSFMCDRDMLRKKAHEGILRVQEENRKSYNKNRKQSIIYKEGDLVAIKRTQYGSGLKIKPKYLGPYKVRKVKGKDRYEVEKIDDTAEGPRLTSSSADLMKKWSVFDED